MASAEKWRFVIQPWKEYPPAVAAIRVLNTDDESHTLLFLESLWAFGQRVFAEDEIITVPLNRIAVIPLSQGKVAGSMQRNQAPRDERFAMLTYYVADPSKRTIFNQKATSISHEDAVKWNKEFLRSMVMEEGEYNDIINPMIEFLQIQTEEGVQTAGNSVDWESMYGSEIMEATQEEAEEFVNILSDDQIIRLNHLYTGDSINEVKASPNAATIVETMRSETVEGLMENIYVDDDDIYTAHVSYLEGIADSRYDNWESPNAP